MEGFTSELCITVRVEPEFDLLDEEFVWSTLNPVWVTVGLVIVAVGLVVGMDATDWSGSDWR